MKTFVRHTEVSSENGDTITHPHFHRSLVPIESPCVGTVDLSTVDLYRPSFPRATCELVSFRGGMSPV